MGVEPALPRSSYTQVEKLVPTVKYSFRFSVPQYEVNFHAQYLADVAANELIFKLYLNEAVSDRLETGAPSGNWPFSKVAGVVYAYSPAGRAGTVSPLKPFRSVVPISEATIVPVRWRGKGPSPQEVLGDVVAIHSNRAHSTMSSVSLSEVIVMAKRESVSA